MQCVWGFGHCKPSYTCARMRSAQIGKELRDIEMYDWYLMQWNQRSLFKKLLGDAFTSEQLSQMGLATKQARVYQYHDEDHFSSTQTVQKNMRLAVDRVAVIQKKQDAAITPVANLLQEYLKNMLQVGYIFSCSRPLFDHVIGSHVHKFVS